MSELLQGLVFKEPGKHAKVLVRCPKCKGSYYARAEIKRGTMADTEPVIPQNCRLCGKFVKLEEL